MGYLEESVSLWQVPAQLYVEEVFEVLSGNHGHQADKVLVQPFMSFDGQQDHLESTTSYRNEFVIFHKNLINFARELFLSQQVDDLASRVDRPLRDLLVLRNEAHAHDVEEEAESFSGLVRESKGQNSIGMGVEVLKDLHDARVVFLFAHYHELGQQTHLLDQQEGHLERTSVQIPSQDDNDDLGCLCEGL